MRRRRRKIILHNFRLLSSVTADPVGITTDVEGATWKKDLTETWKSSEKRIQGESRCNNRGFIATGKSTENGEKTGHGNLKVEY